MTIEWVETKYCRLAYCDCRDLLPTLPKVDAVVTDPPYGVANCSGGDMRSFGKANYNSDQFEDTEEYRKEVIVPIVQWCIKNTKRMSMTPGIFGMWDYPRAEDVGCFWTPAAQTHGRWGFRTFNPILYYGRSPRAGIGDWPSGVMLTESAEKNGHPCPKPIGAWTWLVVKTSNEGETVFDPFMGSGTTGVACVRTGRKFIGCEIDPKYFQIALKRIQDEEAKPDLFAAYKEQPKAKAGDLFASLKES